MEGKLIRTEEGYYLVDNSTIKKDSYYLALDDSYSPPKWVRYVLSSGLSGIEQCNIVGSDLDLEGCEKLSKQNCDVLFGEIDVEELSLDSYMNADEDNIPSSYDHFQYGFEQGFNKAMELNKGKVFTLENMHSLFSYLDTQNRFTRFRAEGALEHHFYKKIGLLLKSTEVEVETNELIPNSKECLILKRI